MSFAAIYNSPWMYLWVVVLLIAVIIQSLIYMRKAWLHASYLGIHRKDIKKGLTTGITISILPTIPVLLVFLSLIQLLGTPLVWLRLSIIGSAHYEAYAASVAMGCVGEELILNGYTIKGWIMAAWVMTIGGSACIVWSTLAIKPISKMYEKAASLNMKLVGAIGSGCLVGIMAFVSVAYGLGDLNTKGKVFLISFAVGALVVFIYHKWPEQKWLSDYCMAVSMVIAMAAACFIF